MNLLVGLCATLLALRGLVALVSDITNVCRRVSAALGRFGAWFSQRWHHYALRRDKARSRHKTALEASSLETISLLAQQLADANAKNAELESRVSVSLSSVELPS